MFLMGCQMPLEAGNQLTGIFTTIGKVLTTALRSAIGVAIQAVMPFFGV
ncbi:hypothetical protein P7H25_08725 [Paenibacillus larvae]|nr:hypothetical protein [Paenibacillus larvae]MDT2255704.1 hypothetical protein [Paenibacillus larvae]